MGMCLLGTGDGPLAAEAVTVSRPSTGVREPRLEEGRWEGTGRGKAIVAIVLVRRVLTNGNRLYTVTPTDCAVWSTDPVLIVSSSWKRRLSA